MSLTVAAIKNSPITTVNTDYKHQQRQPSRHNNSEQLNSNAQPSANRTDNFKLIIIVSVFLALLVGTIKVFAEYAGAELARAGHTNSKKIHRVIINTDMVSIPANMIRYASQRRLREARKLDIYFHWPSQEGYSEALKAVFNSTHISEQIIFVTLAPRFSHLDMSERIRPIYKKFFIGRQKQIDHNLTSVQLDPENGFINEYMIIENSGTRPFVARCVKSGKSGGSPYCIRDINIGEDLSLTYRFHSDLIPQWFDLEQSIIKKFSAMIL